MGDDYQHVIGSGVNLDYKLSGGGGGPYPYTIQECIFTVLWQLVSNRSAWNRAPASFCTNLMDCYTAGKFAQLLLPVFANVKSALDNTHAPWSFAWDLHSATSTDILPTELASIPVLDSRHEIVGEKGRSRMVLLYNGETVEPPCVEVVLLCNTLLDFCDDQQVNFGAFVHEFSISSRKFFRDALGEYAGFISDNNAKVTNPEQNVVVFTSRPDVMRMSCTDVAVIAGQESLPHMALLDVLCVSISADQRLILHIIVHRGENVFVSGPAGVGKSFLTRLVIQEFQLRDVNHAVTASTGKASVVIGGVTFHSWSGMGLGQKSASELIRDIDKKNWRNRTTGRIANRPKEAWTNTEAIILDECSMFTVPMFQKADKIGRHYRQRPTILFGDIQMIMVGDYFQLPPVYGRGQAPRLPFCFQCAEWRAGMSWEIELEKVFRQDDEDFIALLNHMRRGECGPEEKAFLLSRTLARISENEKAGELFQTATQVYPLKERVKRINAAELAKIPKEAERYTYTWKYQANTALNPTPYELESASKHFQSNLPVTDRELFVVGARVLCTANVVPGVIINGSSGTVVGFRTDSFNALDGTDRLWPNDMKWPIVRFDGSGEERVMFPWTWKRLRPSANSKKEKPVGRTDSSNRTSAKNNIAVGQKRLASFTDFAEGSSSDSEQVSVIGDDDPWVARVSQIPLQLGYAITTHRSQGMTLRSAIVGASGNFAPGQLYVAVSRVKSPQGLFLDKLDIESDLRADPRVISYYDKIRLRKKILFASKKRFDSMFANFEKLHAERAGDDVPAAHRDELEYDRKFFQQAIDFRSEENNRYLFADLFRKFR